MCLCRTLAGIILWKMGFGIRVIPQTWNALWFTTKQCTVVSGVINIKSAKSTIMKSWASCQNQLIGKSLTNTVCSFFFVILVISSPMVKVKMCIFCFSILSNWCVTLLHFISFKLLIDLYVTYWLLIRIYGFYNIILRFTLDFAVVISDKITVNWAK